MTRVESFLIFVLVVIGVLLLVGVLAFGVALLPIVIPLGIIYLCFVAPAWGIPLLVAGILYVAIMRKA